MRCKTCALSAGILALFLLLMVACTSPATSEESQSMPLAAGPYRITQYGQADGAQRMCYSIEAPNGDLILIDGGDVWDAEEVRGIIQEHGNRVEHWILTHPHSDHIGAFNTIFPDLQGIEIGRVYAMDMDYDFYQEQAESWDNFPMYEYFTEITAGYDALQYLYTGDVLDLSGLHMEVFNAAQNVPDPANNGSLMFRLTAEEESILFCADVGEIMSEEIMQTFGERLPSDYLQMGHHGNGGLSDAFYAQVAPKVSFFDAPDWLMENHNPATGLPGTWDTPENKQLMLDMGSEVLSFSTTPNTIELH